ncbi:MAG: YetF domain-containing protein [Rivularia sp. (in: cyanobacteria)]
MLDGIGSGINYALGLDAKELNLWQMGLRAAVIYVAGWIMVRIAGDRRFLGKYAAFDVILSIIFGSTLSRTINGSAPFFPTIGAGFVLVGMHWLFAGISFHFPAIEQLIKGSSRVLIRDGEINYKNMQKSHISEKDLESSLRSQAKLTEPSQVKIARLESGGDISVLPKEKQPQIIEMSVEEGVKTIRIEL